MHTFQDAPATPFDAHGALRFGTYRGALRDIDYRGVVAAPRRLLREKRWLWLMVWQAPWLLAMATVRTGYAANSFVFLQHMDRSELAFDGSATGLPGAAEVRRRAGHTLARFGSPRSRGLQFEMDGDRGALHGRSSAAQFTLQLQRTQAVSIVAEVPGELGSCTEKGLGEVSEGRLEFDGQRLDLGGALWGYDLTHGLLARETRWRWAFGLARDAQARPVGFNLTEGFVDAAECVRFDGELGPQPLGGVRFGFEPQRPQEPWRVRGEHGLDLLALPTTPHRERKRLGLVRSDFLQAPARLGGQVPGSSVRDYVGVVEDQFVRW